MSRKLSWVWVLAGSLVIWAGPGAAEETKAQVKPSEEAKAAAAEAEPDVVTPEARAAIKRAAEFLRGKGKLAFSADIAYDVLQEDGGLLEFGELRRYVLKRPDKLRIDADRRALGPRTTYFNGASLTVWSPDQKAYASVKLKQHRDVDEAVRLLRDRLGMPVPLGELLVSDAGKGLNDAYAEAFVVGEEKLDGMACDHVAVRNEHTEVEIWVSKAKEPLILRVRIVYRTLPGEPRFSARLSDWSFSPKAADAEFEFEPPKDAQRVRFALGGSGTPPAKTEGATP